MTDEEKAREAVLAWITRANSLLNSAALREITIPGGELHWREAETLNIRCKNLATRWDEKFSKTWHLLGITEAAAQRVSDYSHALETIVKHATTPKGRRLFTSVHVEDTRDRVLTDLAKLSKMVAVTEDRSSRNIRPQIPRGRPSAKWVSIEVFDNREEAGKTLSKIGAEAREVRVGVSKRIYGEHLEPEVPSSRTVEDHIREKFTAHHEKHLGQKP